MAKRVQRDAGREVYWRSVVGRQRQSGLSVRAFCEQEGVAEPSFYSWRRTIRQRDAQQQTRPTFVPAVVGPDQNQQRNDDGLIAIELRGGRMLRLPASMPPDRLALILHALEGSA